MRKAFLVIGIAAWSILGSVILAILVLGLSGSNMPKWVQELPGVSALRGGNGEMFYFNIGGSTELIKEESFKLEGIGTVSIAAASERITVTLNNGNEMIVRQYDNSHAQPFTSGKGNGSLDISTRDKPIAIGIMVFNFSPRLEISIPRSYAGNVSLAATSGSIHINDRVKWGNTLITASSGSIRLNSSGEFGDLRIKTSSGSIRSYGVITGDAAEISSTSGSIRLDGGAVRCASLNVRSTSGSITLYECEASGQVTVKSSSGSIRSSGIKAGDVTVESTSGSQTLGTVEASGTIRLTSSSGSVKADAVRSPAHHIRTASGSIRIHQLTGEGDVRSSSGSVRTG
jgi:DUF4097 and DUF4098 domain-containing protein YvlB